MLPKNKSPCNCRGLCIIRLNYSEDSSVASSAGAATSSVAPSAGASVVSSKNITILFRSEMQIAVNKKAGLNPNLCRSIHE